jgi:hypothetical protein
MGVNQTETPHKSRRSPSLHLPRIPLKKTHFEALVPFFRGRLGYLEDFEALVPPLSRAIGLNNRVLRSRQASWTHS